MLKLKYEYMIEDDLLTIYIQNNFHFFVDKVRYT